MTALRRAPGGADQTTLNTVLGVSGMTHRSAIDWWYLVLTSTTTILLIAIALPAYSQGETGALVVLALTGCVSIGLLISPQNTRSPSRISLCVRALLGGRLREATLRTFNRANLYCPRQLCR